jgi:hypothetical protein
MLIPKGFELVAVLDIIPLMDHEGAFPPVKEFLE